MLAPLLGILYILARVAQERHLRTLVRSLSLPSLTNALSSVKSPTPEYTTPNVYHSYLITVNQKVVGFAQGQVQAQQIVDTMINENIATMTTPSLKVFRVGNHIFSQTLGTFWNGGVRKVMTIENSPIETLI